MKHTHNFILRLTTVFLFIVTSYHLYGQKIVNNNQTETIKLPLPKIVAYFNDFNKMNSYKDYNLLDLDLRETKIDSINQKENVTVIYLTENNKRPSKIIVTNLNDYQKIIKEKSFEANILMLHKGEYNSETLKQPIKPVIHESLSKDGILKWKIEIESIDANSSKLTFVFNSLDKKNQPDFIKDFSKGIDNYFNYTIQQIYVAERFKQNMIKYLNTNSKSDARDVSPNAR